MLTLGIKTMLIIAFSTDGVRNYIILFRENFGEILQLLRFRACMVVSENVNEVRL